MKNIITLLSVLILSMGLIGCPVWMDLKVDTLPMSSEYGSISPRVSTDKCRYYTKENAPDSSTYTVLAQYIVQETPTVIISRSAQEMICHIYETAVQKGADTIIVDEMGTTNVAGGYARTSPVVKIRAIRFKGQPPQDLR
jgi:hypothetical protein